MTIAEGAKTRDLSRRGLLHGVALVAVGSGALLGAGSAAAQGKMSQQAAAYQPTAKGQQRCNNCIQWQPPSSCKVVEGVIAPTGWCNLWAGKS